MASWVVRYTHTDGTGGASLARCGEPFAALPEAQRWAQACRRESDVRADSVRVCRHVEAELTHGGRGVRLRSWDKKGREQEATYFLEWRGEVLWLVKDAGETYALTPGRCGCEDWQFVCGPNGCLCKHQASALALGLFEREGVAP